MAASLIIQFFFALISPQILKIQVKIQKRRNKKLIKKQIEKREKVKELQRDKEKKNGKKLDSIYYLLISISILIIGIILVQLFDPIISLLESFRIIRLIGFETAYIIFWIIVLFIFTQGILKLRTGIYLKNITNIADRREKLIRSYSTPATPKINVIESWLDPKYKDAIDEFDYKEFGIPKDINIKKKNNRK